MTVAELELALEIGSPQIIGHLPADNGVPRGAVTRTADRLHQAMSVQHRVDGALGGNEGVRNSVF